MWGYCGPPKHVLPCSQGCILLLYTLSDCVCTVGDNEAEIETDPVSLSVDPKSVKSFTCQAPNQLLGVLLLPFQALSANH